MTGANEPGKHAVTWSPAGTSPPDGTIEAAEIRAGDPCPRCGSPLSIDRGIEIGHIFQLGRKYADAFGLDALGPDGKPIRITMGSYGIGVSRAVAVIAEQSHDELGPGVAARGRRRPTCTSSPPARTNQIEAALELAADARVARPARAASTTGTGSRRA